MDTKILALILVLLGTASVFYTQHNTQPSISSFAQWKLKFNINYNSMFEEAYREKIFLENVAQVELHNSQSHTYTKSINQFTGLTQEEFAATYLTLIVPDNIEIIEDQEDNVRGVSIDWTTQGAVTGVKNQGSCGSCWAFSTTGSLEGAYFLAKKGLINFSEQNLVDCSTAYGNHGCQGGLMSNSFKYIKDNGITTQDVYPYKGVQGTCQVKAADYKVAGYTEGNSCTDLANVITNKPISVAVDASKWSTYGGGVFNNCGTSLNHGVTLVGVTDASWTIKNSWGTGWGEKGFIRLARGNTCGVCNMYCAPNL